LEIQEYENQQGRKLDSTDSDDVVKIKELLLQDQIEADKLYADLKQIGEQREVAHITHDGIVINGNRRMATIEKLHKDEPTGKWTDLWVVRLPEDISEKDLWKIEAGLQLSKDKVADYGPVNNLLMIKEGSRAGLKHSEIAASMYGWTEKQVSFDLERLNLIDIFLDFLGQKNNYGVIKRFQLNEHFINIQKYLVQKLKESGLPKNELNQKLETIFIYLKAHITKPDLINITHLEVRSMCKILLDDKSNEALTSSFSKYNNSDKIPVDKLIDNLDKATDIKKNQEDKQKPVKLIERAITALNGIERSGTHYKKSDVKKKLTELFNVVLNMKKELGIK